MKTAVGEFRFTVINDLHYMEAECGRWLLGLMRKINATPGNELVLVLGDLAEEGTREELTAARDILRTLRAPWYVVPGNHDGPPGRPSGGLPGSGAEGLKVYEALFPGRRNYWFEHKGWQFLGLDTTDGSGYQKLAVTAETVAFARRAAGELDREKPTILFTHFPLDPTVKYSLSDGHALLEVLDPLNLRIVFSGHFHGRSEHLAPGREGREPLKLLTNRCVSRTREIHDGGKERGYFDCWARGDGTVEYGFVEFGG